LRRLPAGRRICLLSGGQALVKNCLDSRVKLCQALDQLVLPMIEIVDVDSLVHVGKLGGVE
jgi:hypothetical protein